MIYSTHDEATRSAREAIETPGTALGECGCLSVQCRRSHHIGAIYATPAGLVLRTRTGPRSHGTRDFYSSAHGAARHGECVDILDAGPLDLDDRVPGWCACGTWTLLRQALRDAIAAHTRTIRVDGDQPS